MFSSYVFLEFRLQKSKINMLKCETYTLVFALGDVALSGSVSHIFNDDQRCWHRQFLTRVSLVVLNVT